MAMGLCEHEITDATRFAMERDASNTKEEE